MLPHVYQKVCQNTVCSSAIRKSSLPPAHQVLPQFNFAAATHTVHDVASNLQSFLDTQKRVNLHGHLNRPPRIRSKISFAELRDTNGDTVQLIMMPQHTAEEYFRVLKGASVEDSVSVSGTVQLKKLVPGEAPKWELVVTSLQVLNLATEEAARLDKLKHSEPARIPAHYRFLQLRTKELQRNLKMRAQFSSAVREVLAEKHNFTEIETPLLFKSTPEGAREFLVPTRKPNEFYALPQSPQQYKQILMSSGFTRYFQLAKCFRDEDLRADRQPEFTQVDLEMSFVSDTSQVMSVVEDVVHEIFCKANKPLFTPKNSGEEVVSVGRNSGFYKITYQEALESYGIDKPDLRSSLQIQNLSSFFRSIEHTDFDIVEVCVLKGALKSDGIPGLLTNHYNYTRRVPTVIAINETNASTWFKPLLESGQIRLKEAFNAKELDKLLELEKGDIIAVSNRSVHPYENPTPLGRFRQLAINEFPHQWRRLPAAKDNHTDPEDTFVACWVLDFPLFSPCEENSGNDDPYPKYNWDIRESTHHPFTMAKPEDYQLLDSKPYDVHGEHYDLVINGVEVGGGSRRIHNPEVQRYVLEHILRIKDYDDLFGHLLEALSFGCPPHAGLALGFDRLCAMLVGSQSIRDVIAFPKNQSGADPVVSSPSSVSPITLADYHVQVKQ